LNRCPGCGKEIDPNWNFCKFCRYDLRKGIIKDEPKVKKVGNKKICPNCGSENALTNKFCLKCGNKFGDGPIGEPTSPIKPVPNTSQPTYFETGPPPMQYQTEKPEINPTTAPADQYEQAAVETEEKGEVKTVKEIKQEKVEQEKKVAIKPEKAIEEEEQFEYINWIKNHGLRTITEIKNKIYDNCDMLNTYLFQILSEIREYSEWTTPQPIKDKKYLQKYGSEVEEYAKSIDCKKLDNKSRCKAIIETFIDSLNEAVIQLIALI
jgi:hypothetical protein